ncbi:hypothetical protein [Bacteriophage Eos]|nr:hypothetical protein [Bacteriophage Eos]
MFKFTEKFFEINGVLVLTLWEGQKWCSVTGLKPEDQTPENIEAVKASMIKAAKRKWAPRNGVRVAYKC